MWALQLNLTVMLHQMLKHGFLALVIYSGLSQLRVTGISRSDVITRAQFWTNIAVPYSQSEYHADPNGKCYRTDCSGFVSMAWNLSASLHTASLPKVSTSITKEDLKQGDIILKSAGENRHVVIFDKWTSDAETRYWAYDQTPPNAIYHEIRYPYWNKTGYSPYRYKNIVEESIGTSANGPCDCPKHYISQEKLQHYNALQASLCGFQMTGRCNPKNVYICGYYYRLPHPTPHELSICPFGCAFSKYVKPHCQLNQTQDLPLEREQHLLIHAENNIICAGKPVENTNNNADVALFLQRQLFSSCLILFSKTLLCAL